jgi:4-amino-4-deoxy-L-arabinose transferase-like glycosyltransferase
MWVLPILCWFFSAWLLARRGSELRAAFLTAAVLWGCLVTAFTELLGHFHLLTMGGLAVCWTAATVVALMLNFKLEKPWRVWGSYPLTAVETGLLGGIGLICLATFVTAIIAPPNTGDSMTYHMSRVMHWLQNRSVDHYPTHILRQIELNPWAEFAITHFQALSGGDRFANLVQWFSMIGSLLGASLIAGQLGGDRRAQLVAVVVVAAIPMGILQSSSTQNDYAVAFWLVCLAWAGMQFMKGKELQWAVVAGASLGLAVLTKGTAYLYAFPFAVWIAFGVLRGAPRQMGLAVVCLVIPFLLLNLPHYYRNMGVFSNPLGSGEHKFANESLSAGALVSNVLRNTGLQLSSPSDGLNQLIMDSVAKLHESLGISLNDPGTTWPGTEFKIDRLTRHEDTDGNFLHVVLAVSVLLTLGFSVFFRKDVDRPVVCYVFSVVAGFFLFCLILKWQPWHSRLLLPLFVLGAPAVGVIARQHWKPSVAILAAMVLLMASLPWAVSNVSRPLVIVSEEGKITFPLLTGDRNQIYFHNRPGLYHQYVKITNDLRQRNAANLGLVLSEDAWEYPLWVLIGQGSPASVRIEHIGVKNASRFTRTADFRPDCVLEID